MRAVVVGAIALFAMAAPATFLFAAQKDREPEALVRTGKWHLNYDRDACHLEGTFGKGDAEVIARFTRYDHGEKFDLSLTGKRFSYPATRADAKIDFGIQEMTSTAMFGTRGGAKLAVFPSLRLDGLGLLSDRVLPKITPEQEAQIKSITVRIPRKAPFRLEFASLGQSFAQMDDCTTNLVKSWGYDPVVQATLSQPVVPITAPNKWLDSKDYPVSALRSGANGIVQFRLDIDADGKITGCHVLARTSPDDFADITCRAILKRAQLLPALDAQGKRVRSYHVQKARWMMEAGPSAVER